MQKMSTKSQTLIQGSASKVRIRRSSMGSRTTRVSANRQEDVGQLLQSFFVSEHVTRIPDVYSVTVANNVDVYQKITPSNSALPKSKDDYRQEYSTDMEVDSVEEDHSGTLLFQEKSSILYYLNTDYEPTKLCFKNGYLELHILNIIMHVVRNYESIKAICLEFSNISTDVLEFLSNCLRNSPQLMSLSLNGNNLSKTNFVNLLHNTGVNYISLKYCKIGGIALESIAEVLRQSEGMPKITAICLAGNEIDDDGLRILSQGLRANRTLYSLNLAANWFTDEGCSELLQVLQAFKLTHNEVVQRRFANIEYFKSMKVAKESEPENRKSQSSRGCGGSIISINRPKSYETMNKRRHFSGESKNTSNRPNSGLTPSKRANSISSRITPGNPRSRPGSPTSVRPVSAENDRNSISTTLAVSALEKNQHPYLRECYRENKAIYCQGNLVLCHLNLSHNNITDTTLKNLIKVIQYQCEIATDMKYGLLHIVLDETTSNRNPEIEQQLYNAVRDLYHVYCDNIGMERPRLSTSQSTRSVSAWSSVH